MRLIIRNKWISIGGSSYVRDENENDLLKVKGKIFTFTHKKFVKELDGKKIYMVRNKFWYFIHRQAMIYDMEGNKLAHLSRKFFSLHDHYNIETANHGTLVIRGNILGYDYHIYENDVEIGHVTRKISLRDSFVLDIKEGADWKFYCALVIAIDNLTDSRSGGSYSSSSSGNY